MAGPENTHPQLAAAPPAQPYLLLVHAPHKHAALVLPDLQVLRLGAQQILRTA